MKRSVITFLILLFSASVYAQNDMQIHIPGVSYPVNDSTIVIWGAVNTDHTQLAFITNKNSGTLYVKPKYQVTTSVSGGQNSFCWGVVCYGANSASEFECTFSDTIRANRTDSTFSGHYYDYGNAGTNVVRYVFYNTANPADSAWVIVKYVITPLGIEQLSANSLHISAPYPNPARNVATFNYNLNGTQQAVLEVYNSIGQTVQRVNVSSMSDRFDMNVSALPSGIYICKMEAEGIAPVFQKMMVAH